MTEPIDPKHSQFHMDSCAFDNPAELAAATEILKRCESGELSVVLAHSTEKEIDHPKTPAWTKARAGALIFTENVDVELTPQERTRWREIERVLVGNSTTDRYLADAQHVFEASRCGAYFVYSPFLRDTGTEGATTTARVLRPISN